ncbi:MAG: hypothetical protein HY716_10200 [Planctomycetes bacterium]|nr:hypothetical protein [Planctomycetota bacterium]
MTDLNAVWAVGGLMALGALASLLFGGGGSRRAGVAFFAAWFVPGAGHLILGRWVKALALFGLLAATYGTGLWLCGWRHVSFEDNPFYYIGQFGSGVTMFLGQLLGDPKAYPREDMPPSWFDNGMLYMCVAGLLNVVIMMSVFDAARGRKAVEAPAPEAGRAAP